jgi:pSer/pThr/pTyr-binding forkhead associated (FHA) protein
MPLACSRCGHELSGSTQNTCPRCGAPRPDPAWTQPFSQAAVATMQSRAVNAGTLSGDKKYAIVIVNGGEPGRVIPIEKARITIGRADCDIVLDDPQLSRQHALVAINGTSARLEDLGSTNGTFVDEKRIEQIELEDRMEFRIGSHELVFVVTEREDD